MADWPESFEGLNAWRSARDLTRTIYRLCRRPRLARDFGQSDQLRRAAVSVMNNLAEGWESAHFNEKKQFYTFARRSCGEVRSMTYVLLDDEQITETEQQELVLLCINTGKLISGLIKSLDNRS